ncbi:MAG: DUF4386 domain-containing protein [Sphingobacteriaceae bacterium]|nr:DUF4386 domain-containing protein [Cytophagaceae bacterium]
MKTEKVIGLLLISGAVLVMVPYTVLSLIFDYPNILRQDAGTILIRFHAGGSTLVWVWWAFAVLGLPLLPAYVLMGRKLEAQLPFVRVITTLGVLSVVVQVVGLLRWTFVVPVLAEAYVTASSEATREACNVVFMAIHQYGGVVLGEHLGQLLTIAWTVGMAHALRKLGFIPAWVSGLGYFASGIYLLAQAELFATVLPGVPVWNLAGLLGSTLWLVWLVVVGVRFLRLKID